jgi:hypothetical protein
VQLKSWLSNWKRRRESDVAAELRASKPEPAARFVKQLAARINPRPAQPVRTRTRLGLAAAVTATMVAVVGATGGFSAAASTIAGATHSVAQITHISSTPSALVKSAAAPRSTSGPTSADSQYAEAPTISSFSPESGPVGTTVTVSGTHFSGASNVSSVSLGDSPASATIVSDTTLTFAVPAGASTGTISVSNAAGSDTSTDSFTVFQTPAFDEDTPFSPSDGGVGQEVTLSGTHFTGVNSVTIGGKAAPINSISDTEIDTAVPAGAKAGTGSITIKGPAGSASASGFTVDSGSPAVTSFSPTSGAPGASIKITGTNLLNSDLSNPDVMFTGAADAATFTDGKTQSKTALFVDVPADAESGTITVMNTVGSGTSKTSFIVLGTPNISSVSPAFGVKNTPVVIKGDTFTGAKSVTFSSDGNPDVTVNLVASNIKGDTQITVKAPSLVAGATYTVKVTGKTSDVSAASSDTFYFEQKPAIASDGLDPASGGTGTQVTIASDDGNTFLGATKVTFGTKTATIVSKSNTDIDVLVPAALNTSATPKNVNVVVSNAAGGSAPATFSALNSGPTVSAFTPAAAQASDTLKLTGTHLTDEGESATVTFNGGSSCIVANGALTPGTSGHNETISFSIPDCARTGTMTVNTTDGSVTTKSVTIYVQPVVLGIKPSYGGTKTATKVTVQGAPGTFTGAYEVDFDAVKGTGLSVAKGGSSLAITAPAHMAAGTYKITVKVDKTEPLSGNSGNTGFTVLNAPTVSGFGEGDTGGMAGDTLTVEGTNFLGVQSVTFGTVKATFQAVVDTETHTIDSTQLTVFIPTGAVSNKISVTTAGGKATSSAAYPVLAITKVSPASAKHGRTATITVTGSGFKFGGSFARTTATIGGGDPITPKAGSTDTKLLLALPTTLDPGTYTIEISNDLGDVMYTTFKLT